MSAVDPISPCTDRGKSRSPWSLVVPIFSPVTTRFTASAYKEVEQQLAILFYSLWVDVRKCSYRYTIALQEADSEMITHYKIIHLDTGDLKNLLAEI